MIGGEDDQRLVGPPRLFEHVQKLAHAKIKTRDCLVVVGQVGAHARQIGQEVGYDHFVGAVENVGYAAVLFFVAEAAGRTMGIDKANMHIEGLILVLVQEDAGTVGHLHCAARVDCGFIIKGIDAERFDVLLANTGGGVPRLAQSLWRRAEPLVGAEALDAMRVSVLSMHVAMVAAENTSPAHRARWAGAERGIEDDAALGKFIDARRLDDVVAIALGQRTPVVGDQKENVAELGHGENLLKVAGWQGGRAV